jgi:hypothetical protein
MVERVVVLEAESDGAKDGSGTVRARASFIPTPDAPAGWRPADGTCEREPTGADPNAVRGGATVALDFGEPLELHWDAQQHEFHGEEDASGRDLAWQPVSISSAGTGVWAFESRRALQFGERPVAWIAERRPTGDVVVRWHGSYARKDLLVRVIGGAGERLVCAPGADQVVVPWWAMTLAGASIELAATRREHVLTDTGTLLVGAATIVVPVAEDARQVLETLSSEQPAEEQRSRSFGPNRVRKGTRPGSTRSSPS